MWPSSDPWPVGSNKISTGLSRDTLLMEKSNGPTLKLHMSGTLGRCIEKVLIKKCPEYTCAGLQMIHSSSQVLNDTTFKVWYTVA